MRRATVVLLSVALVAAAVLVRATTPDAGLREAPFVERASLGVTAPSRELDVRMLTVGVAETLGSGDEELTTSGVWVVAALTAAAVNDPTGVQATLLVDGRSYAATGRLGGATLDSGYVDPGLPQSGVVAFEVPRELVDAGRTVVIRISASSAPRLDAVVDLAVDLGELGVQRSIAVPGTGLDEDALAEGWP